MIPDIEDSMAKPPSQSQRHTPEHPAIFLGKTKAPSLSLLGFIPFSLLAVML